MFYMKINGRYIDGVFTPYKGERKNYEAFIKKIEDGAIKVSIEIKKAVNDVSENQVGLYWVIIGMVEESTGSTTEQIMHYTYKYRPLKQDGIPKSFNQMNTVEMSEFIETCIIGLNDDFNLNLTVQELSNGQCKVTNIKK